MYLVSVSRGSSQPSGFFASVCARALRGCRKNLGTYHLILSHHHFICIIYVKVGIYKSYCPVYYYPVCFLNHLHQVYSRLTFSVCSRLLLFCLCVCVCVLLPVVLFSMLSCPLFVLCVCVYLATSYTSCLRIYSCPVFLQFPSVYVCVCV